LEEISSLLLQIREDKPLPTDIDSIIEEYNALEGEIRIELNSLTPQQKQDTIKELQGYKKIIDDCQKRRLLGSGKSTSLNPDADQRSVDQHQRNMERLHKSRQQLHQAELDSEQTIENLDKQTEQMNRINHNLQTNQQELSTSTRLLNHMNKWWRG
jgi:DNA repair exonuclease SbcCD ATPase subunit